MNSLLTTRQLCEELSISRQTAYKWRKAGCPTVVSSGNMCRYNYDEVIEWLNSRRVANV
jgi:excisionase family DNA binding protein